MADLKYIGKNILNHDLIVRKGNVSGSATSTGSFGRVETAGNLSVAGGTLFGPTNDHFDIKSGKNIRLYLDNDDNSSFCKFQIHDGSGDTVFAVAESGNATIGEGITANHVDGLSVVGSVSASADGTGSFGRVNTVDGILSPGTVESYGNFLLRESAGGDKLVDVLGSSDDGLIRIYQNNSVKARIHGNGTSYINGGNFAIGTTAAPEELTIEGNISASGALMGVTHVTASGNISG